MQTVAWDQRFGRRFFFKAAYLHRDGSHAYIVDPDAGRAAAGARRPPARSRYWEIETTGRFLASEHRDLTVSYVRSHSTRDLNDYDQFFGNFRNPIIRPNETVAQPDRRAAPADRARHASGCRGSGCSRRSSNGARGSRGRRSTSFRISSARGTDRDGCRRVSTLDFTLARPWRFRKYHFTAGLKVFNAFDTRQRARRADQPRVARLRKVLQPDPARDRVRCQRQQALRHVDAGKRTAYRTPQFAVEE